MNLGNLIKLVVIILQKIEEQKMQLDVMKHNIDNYQNLLQKQVSESKKKDEISKRSYNRFNKLIRDNNIDMDNTDLGSEIKLNNEKLKNKFLKNSISILAAEIDEVRNIFSSEMQDFNIPSRPISVISQESRKSNITNESHNTSKHLSETH